MHPCIKTDILNETKKNMFNFPNPHYFTDQESSLGNQFNCPNS